MLYTFKEILCIVMETSYTNNIVESSEDWRKTQAQYNK